GKSFGALPLFDGVSFPVSERDRIGLIGPNGSGKSTLLQILAGRIPPDSGEVTRRKLTRLSYVAQESQFPSGLTVREVIARALHNAAAPESEREGVLAETLGRAGFDDFEQQASALSGGWKKRLAIAEALVEQPDILLLDEPTNHLDLAAIDWLEEFLIGASFASVVVTHDRYFLENYADQVAELNRAYPGGLLRIAGNYSKFLEKKEEYLLAQARHQEALENRVRNEIEWLRRGPKARTTKSKARIDRAHELMSELADLNARTRTSTANIELASSERRTKRLVEMEDVAYEIGGRTLFSNLTFTITAGMRVGLVGPNGSGKTTLLRLIEDAVEPSSGQVRRADMLRIVHFDQNRVLDANVTLARALAPDSDSVVYQDRVIHVASWAARFLFNGEQLRQPVGRLSGGERARILIARMMLEPADVLLLDEPTNDLDIQTLEILEESLLEYRGALVMVTHDRYLLDRVSTIVIGLDGQGGIGTFADYPQWELWYKQQRASSSATATRDRSTGIAPARQNPARKKLSYLEAREYADIEQRIAEAEADLARKRAAFESPAIASHAEKLLVAQRELDAAQKAVDTLVERWAELEQKQGSA
ncbi:MAG: ABC-F family ATP-binding cassette domain-containing protein, partial [Terriglobales bacterium]